MANKKAGSGGQRKVGRAARKPSKVRYKASNQRDKNKRKRILQSNGEHALAAWIAGDKAQFPRKARGRMAAHDRQRKAGK